VGEMSFSCTKWIEFIGAVNIYICYKIEFYYFSSFCNLFLRKIPLI